MSAAKRGEHKGGALTTSGLNPRKPGWGGRTGSYPSGRPSKGGANRSSNIKRVVKELTRRVVICPTCGGVAPDIIRLTDMWRPCQCVHPESSTATTD